MNCTSSIATNIYCELIIHPHNVTFTYSSRHELEEQYNYFDTKLRRLEESKEASLDELNQILNEVKIFPKKSENRLEFEIRINHLRTKWGVSQSCPVNVEPNIEYPLDLNLIDNALLKEGYMTYMSVGKDGRKWMKAQLQAMGYLTFPSKEKMINATEKVLTLYNTYMDTLHKALDPEGWLNGLKVFAITIEPKQLEQLFEKWLEYDRNKLKTLTQINNWIIQEKKIWLLNQENIDTIDYSLFISSYGIIQKT